jgi:DegV family protein with EDD domain
MEKETGKIVKKPLGLVTDDIADLPREFLEKYQIQEAAFTTRFPDGEIIKSKEEIYSKMTEAVKKGKPLPTTSAPTFAEYLALYQKALEKFEKILVITVSSKLSAAYSSARIARSIFKKLEKLNIYVFDCNSGEAAEGLIVMKAQELAERGKDSEKIVEELKSFCPKVLLLGCLSDFKYVVKGGRVKIPELLIAPVSWVQKLGIKIIIKLQNGRVGFLGLRVGGSIARIMAEEIRKQSRGQKIKAAITYANNPQEARSLKEELEKSGRIEVAFVSPVSPVVATHVGSGAMLAAFYPIDGKE